MFTTPERSEMIPPSAAKSSGVANVSPDAITADQVKTSLTFAVVWLVIASASGIATRPTKTAAPPSRAVLAIEQDPDAGQRGDHAEHDRRHRGPDQDRRQRQDPGDRRQHHRRQYRCA